MHGGLASSVWRFARNLVGKVRALVESPRPAGPPQLRLVVSNTTVTARPTTAPAAQAAPKREPPSRPPSNDEGIISLDERRERRRAQQR